MLANRYTLHDRIASGSFGEIYRAEDESSPCGRLAVKFEPCTARFPQLKSEYKTYQKLQGLPGIPRVYGFGQEGESYFLLMQLLGDTIEQRMTQCEPPRDTAESRLAQVLHIADQLMLRMEDIHSRGIIYRDVKPANFVFAASDKSQQPQTQQTPTAAAAPRKSATDTLFVIDFGLSKKLVAVSTTSDKPNRPTTPVRRECTRLVGTARYASINAHRGLELCQRDDLESIGYMLVYLIRGWLPWQGVFSPVPVHRASCASPAPGAQPPSRLATPSPPLPEKVFSFTHASSTVPNAEPLFPLSALSPLPSRKERERLYESIAAVKESTPIEEVCHGLDPEFVEYFRSVRALSYGETPDYAYLRSLFRQISDRAIPSAVAGPIISSSKSTRSSLHPPPPQQPQHADMTVVVRKSSHRKHTGGLRSPLPTKPVLLTSAGFVGSSVSSLLQQGRALHRSMSPPLAPFRHATASPSQQQLLHSPTSTPSPPPPPPLRALSPTPAVAAERVQRSRARTSSTETQHPSQSSSSSSSAHMAFLSSLSSARHLKVTTVAPPPPPPAAVSGLIASSSSVTTPVDNIYHSPIHAIPPIPIPFLSSPSSRNALARTRTPRKTTIHFSVGPSRNPRV